MSKEYIVSACIKCPQCKCTIIREEKISRKPTGEDIRTFSEAVEENHKKLHASAYRGLRLEEEIARFQQNVKDIYQIC